MRPMQLVPLAVVALALYAVATDRPTPARADSHSTTLRSSSGNGYHYGSWKDDTGGGSESFQYMLVDPTSDMTTVASDEDGMGNLARVQEEAKRTHQRLWWFRMDGRSYLVRDPETTGRAQKIVEPMQELGREQGRLGGEQGRWGALQGRLGALQGRIGAMEARIAVASVGSESDADRSDLADLKQQVHELSAQARELGEEQGRLGEKQGELGRRQGELGRQQAIASKTAFHDLEALAKDALANGRAEKF